MSDCLEQNKFGVSCASRGVYGIRIRIRIREGRQRSWMTLVMASLGLPYTERIKEIGLATQP